MRKCLVLLLSMAVLCACKNAGKDNPFSSLNVLFASQANAGQSSIKQGAGKWQYAGNVNNISTHTPYIATINADNKLFFGPPYNGSCVASLTLRTANLRTYAMLSVTKGWFKVGTAGISIRFDDKNPIKFACSQSTNGDAGLIFIENTSSLINELKKSKTAVVQAQFYQKGNQQINFSTAGLIWPH